MVCVYLIIYIKEGLYGVKLDDKVYNKYCLTLSTIKNSYYLCEGNINFKTKWTSVSFWTSGLMMTGEL
jgi:hypothetical protein